MGDIIGKGVTEDGRRRRQGQLLALLGIALLASLGSAGQAQAAQTRPNVVVVMTDDQRLYDMEAMPLTTRLVGGAGTTFENAFATYPLCCPSRATFLTGQYEHNHGVIDNTGPDGGYYKFDFSNSLAVWLQAAGYRTAHIGKTLNEYGFRPQEGLVPPGYDDWFATLDPTTHMMYGYLVEDNGVIRPHGVLPSDYQTDVLADRAVEDIRSWAPSDRPFFIHLATSAPHSEFHDGEKGPRPAPRHAGAFSDHPFHPRASYDEKDVTDKPSVIRRYARIGPALRHTIAEQHRARLEALLAVDAAVARIVSELERAGELDQTVIVFTSDNGYLHGEHRVPREKFLPYEESVRVPLLIRGPGFPAGATRRQLVGNIDLAPTIVELADAVPRRLMDGESLLPFARSPVHRRSRSLLLEADLHVEKGAAPMLSNRAGFNLYYDAIRTRRYKYVHWFRDLRGRPANEEELYDLGADPFELQSLHESRRHAALKEALKWQLRRLTGCTGDACRRSVGASVLGRP